MVPISIKKFVDKHAKINTGVNKKELAKALEEAADRKRRGKKCCNCSNTIWALGSAVVGMDMCFPCHTLETDDSEDYEVLE